MRSPADAMPLTSPDPALQEAWLIPDSGDFRQGLIRKAYCVRYRTITKHRNRSPQTMPIALTLRYRLNVNAMNSMQESCKVG